MSGLQQQNLEVITRAWGLITCEAWGTGPTLGSSFCCCDVRGLWDDPEDPSRGTIYVFTAVSSGWMLDKSLLTE